TRPANQRDFARAVEGRVAALARAHTLLADNRWRGADLRRVVEEELAAFQGGTTIEVSGPPVALGAEQIQPLAMVVHELVTNAAKHGALATPEGRLHVSWEKAADNGVQLRWDEAGGPPIAGPPENNGFGSTLIRATVHGQLGGRLELTWRSQGLLCEFSVAPSAPG
ncbi:MAG: HWE histidine kinase domain-containing protein, partial [Geminicoccaceae bacterium]